MILDREAFAKLWAPVHNREDGPLWIPEQANSTRCRWFVKVKPILTPYSNSYSNSYWDWCDYCLQGKVMCFSSSDTEEWWGFNNKDDILIWLLKWS